MRSLDDAEREAMHDVFVKAAVEVVDDVERVLRQPALDVTPVGPNDFRGMDVRWLESSTRALLDDGFVHLRDVDGTPLLAEGSPPAMVRVLLGDANTVSVALYHARPRSPGFFLKLLLMVLGKWPKAPRVVECTSYLDDVVLTTSNQGDANVFAHPPWVVNRTIALGASPAAVLAVHREQIATHAGRVMPRMFGDFDALNRAREEQRVAANRWREEVGLTELELGRLLAPHGEHGQKIRPYIEHELRRRGWWKHA